MRKALSKSIESRVFDTIFAHNTPNTDFDLNQHLIDSHKFLSKGLAMRVPPRPAGKVSIDHTYIKPKGRYIMEFLVTFKYLKYMSNPTQIDPIFLPG